MSLFVGVAEVGAIACRQVPVLGGQFAVPCGCPTVCACFLALTPQAGKAVTLLGESVSLLGAMITLIGAFDEDLDADLGLDGAHLVQHRFLVPLTLVGQRLALVRAVSPLICFPVPPVGPPVTPIGFPVTPIGRPVTPVRRQVPLSTSIALVGGVVALIGHPVTCLAGAMSLCRGLVAQVRSQLAFTATLLTLLRGVDLTLSALVVEGSPHLLRPPCGDPVPLLGDVVALFGHPVTPFGDTVALASHPVALVGAALALAFIGSHLAPLLSGAATNPDDLQTDPGSDASGSLRMHAPLPKRLDLGRLQAKVVAMLCTAPLERTGQRVL